MPNKPKPEPVMARQRTNSDVLQRRKPFRRSAPIEFIERQQRKNTAENQDTDRAPLEPLEPPKIAGGRYLLGREGNKEWRRIAKLLVIYLHEMDRGVMTQYCQLYQEFARSPEDFSAAKHTQMRLCAVELGLTPSARSRLKSSKQAPKPSY